MQYINRLKTIFLFGLISFIISTNLKVNVNESLRTSNTVLSSASNTVSSNPKSSAPFFEDNTINLIKTLVPLITDKMTYSDALYSNLVGGCISQLRDKKSEFLTSLREFWENMRNIFDGNAKWSIGFWNKVGDTFAKFNVNDDKNNPVNCSRFLKNAKSPDAAKITEVLKRGDFFGGYNKAVPAGKSHMITAMFGPRRRLLDKEGFKRINNVSRGKSN